MKHLGIVWIFLLSFVYKIEGSYFKDTCVARDHDGKLILVHVVDLSEKNSIEQENHIKAQEYIKKMSKWLRVDHRNKKPSQKFFTWVDYALDPKKGLEPKVCDMIRHLLNTANEPHRT